MCINPRSYYDVLVHNYQFYKTPWVYVSQVGKGPALMAPPACSVVPSAPCAVECLSFKTGRIHGCSLKQGMVCLLAGP